MKRCPDCGQDKPLDDFPRNKNTRSGRHTYCKPCHAARTRETIKRLYGSGRHYHLKQRYGLGGEEIQAMIDAQGGYCIICFDKPAEHVDHDHTTGKVRGVLCFNCNGGLGQFNIAKLRGAIDYLKAAGVRAY
jgi:hypothetical protein